MAQHGRNGHQDDSGAETASYIFNPMSYNYAQHHSYSAPTVLSQQDATVMNDFFESSQMTYQAFNDGKGGLANAAALATNSQVDNNASHANFGNHMSQQRFGNFDFNVYNHSPNLAQHLTHDTAGDAAASALIGLSTSQEPSLLNTDNYMNWAFNSAQLQTLPPKSHSTSQIQQAMQAPPDQIVSWAGISAAHQNTQQQRTRHQSLQLDTTNPMPVHQNSWQTAPHSALPHVGSRRPLMVTYGSDNSFSPTGFANAGEEKQNIADTTSSTAAPRAKQVPQLMRHHSMSAAVPVASAIQQSPVMMNTLSTPTHQTQAAFQNALMSGNGSGRKRTFNQIDDAGVQQNNVGQYGSANVPLQPRNAGNGTAAQNVSNSSLAVTPIATSTTPVAANAGTNANTNVTGQTRRRQQKEPKPARANLSDAQKRQNHILSEQKRRDTMKTNFAVIGKIVPAVRDNAQMSRSEMLYHLTNHLESLHVGNQICAQLAGLTDAQLDALDILTPEEEAEIEALAIIEAEEKVAGSKAKRESEDMDDLAPKAETS